MPASTAADRDGSVLVIDQGTTSTRAILFGADLAPVASAQEEFRQIFPRPGWVEHDPEDLWRTTLATGREALRRAGREPGTVAAIGIANQRETAIVWERRTGRPIANAIVWQDRRTAERCAALKADGQEGWIGERTGLLADPYFSATKIAWILDHVPGARERAERGELVCGTVDTFLIGRLTQGRSHVTDATNASRTLLYDIRRGRWDDDLLHLFRIPRAMLPEVLDCSAEFGMATPDVFGREIPIRGVAGDQQAALVGQACFAPGMVKSTYGTGCFALLNTGTVPVVSRHRLLTTVAYQIDGQPHYALEGSIFCAGATVQWLRDGLGLVPDAAATGTLAAEADPDQLVYLVPAFAGLGAPHWDSEARALLCGLTRGTTRRELARAALESVAFQTRDLVQAMAADAGGPDAGGPMGPFGATVRVDGGMSASDWTMQSVADIVGCRVDRPRVIETTASGAAYLAGWRAGLYPDPAGFAAAWRLDRTFVPVMGEAERERRCAGWATALRRTLLSEGA